jgi:hypothetical protein
VARRWTGESQPGLAELEMEVLAGTTVLTTATKMTGQRRQERTSDGSVDAGTGMKGD